MRYVSSKTCLNLGRAGLRSFRILRFSLSLVLVASFVGCSPSSSNSQNESAGSSEASGLARQVSHGSQSPVYVTQVSTWLPSGVYGADSTIDIDVTFSGPVRVAAGAAPKIVLNTTPSRFATYVGGAGSNRLSFQYEVQAGDQGPKLDYEDSGSFVIEPGGILDLAGGPVNLALSSPGNEGSLSHLLSAGKGVTVSGLEAGPVLAASASSVSVVAGSVVSVIISDANTGGPTDQNGASLSFSCAYNGGVPCDQLPGHAFSFDSSSGAFRWIPSQALEGQNYRFTVAGVASGSGKLAGSVSFGVSVVGGAN